MDLVRLSALCCRNLQVSENDHEERSHHVLTPSRLSRVTETSEIPDPLEANWFRSLDWMSRLYGVGRHRFHLVGGSAVGGYPFAYAAHEFQDVVDVAIRQRPAVSQLDLVAALNHYAEHDNFMEL